MKLATLTLNNFKAVRNETIHFDGKDVDMFGPNGAGKTTKGADALLWLLFGKDIFGRSDYNIKTTDENGEAFHNLDHSVEGTFVMANGEITTLKRTYREVWPKLVRGAKSESFTGHETECAIDGVGCLVGAYNTYIRELCPVDKFMTLTNASYFMDDNQMDWKQRRNLLFSLVGDMTDEEVIEATPEISDLAALRGKLSVEGERSYRKQCQERRVEANKELTALPNQIKGIDSVLPAEDKTDWAKALKGHTEALQGFQSDRATLLAGGGATPLNTRLAEIGNEIRTIENELRNKPNPDREVALTKQGNKKNELRQAERDADALRLDIAAKVRQMESLSSEINLNDIGLTAKRAEWTAATLKEYANDSKCPACKQDLTASDVQSAVEEFNSAKAKLIAELEASGLALKARSEKLLSDHRAVQEAHNQLKLKLEATEESIGVLRVELEAIVIPAETPVDPAADPRVIALVEERDVVQGQLDQLKQDSSAMLALIDGKIDSVQFDIQTCNTGIATQNQRAASLEQIKSLTARQKEVGKTVEDLDRSLYLCDLFMKAKVDLLTDKINGLFGLTYFRLYRKLVKGDYEPCCEVLWRDTMAFPSTGQTAMIQLDIIDGLSKFLNFFPPVIIDRAESIGKFPRTGGQQIRLHHMRDETALRIVRDGDAVSNAPKSTETVKELALAF